METRRASVRKGSPEEDKTDSWICTLCDQKYTDEKAEMLECEVCSKHFCKTCLKLSSAEYKILTKRSDLHWYCPPCEEKALKNIKIEKEVEERCREYFKKYEERLSNLEKLVSNKPDTDTVKKMIKESGQKSVEQQETNPGAANDLDEYKESMARRNNIVIFRAEEATSKNIDDRKAFDQQLVKDLCEIMDSSEQSVKNITRLGKRNDDAQTPRPLKVVFEDEKSKGRFMQNLKNLSSAEEKYKIVSVTHDMTIKERQQNREMLREAKSRNENMDSGDFKYIVKGPPWDRRLVKTRINP